MPHTPRLTASGIPDLFPEDLRLALQRELAPFARAEPGDLLAIVQTYRSHSSTSAYPATEYIVKTSGGIRAISWTDLPAAHQAGAAILAAHLHAAGFLHDPVFIFHVESLAHDDGHPAFTQFVITADAGLLMVENHEDDIFEGAHHGEDIDTAALRDAMKLIVPQSLESAHERLSARAALAQHAGLFSEIANIIDPDTEARVPVDLPEF